MPPSLHSYHQHLRLTEWQHIEPWTGDKSLSGFIKTQPGQTEHLILSCNTQGDSVWERGRLFLFSMLSSSQVLSLLWCHYREGGGIKPQKHTHASAPCWSASPRGRVSILSHNLPLIGHWKLSIINQHHSLHRFIMWRIRSLYPLHQGWAMVLEGHSPCWISSYPCPQRPGFPIPALPTHTPLHT